MQAHVTVLITDCAYFNLIDSLPGVLSNCITTVTEIFDVKLCTQRQYYTTLCMTFLVHY